MEKGFKDIANDAKDFQELFEALPYEAGAIGEKLIAESFANQTPPDDGGKWEARKNDKDSGRSVLIGKGGGDKLVSSFGFNVVGSTIELGSDKVYAQIHNEGGQITKRGGKGKFTMPKRQFMPIPGEESKELSKRIDDYVNKESNKAFKRNV